MSPELARHLVRPLIAKHPLPWRWEQDWTFEVLDAKNEIVVKLMTAAHAEELIAFADDLAAYDAKGAEEAKRLLSDAGIVLDD